MTTPRTTNRLVSPPRYKSSLDYEIFQVVQAIIIDYNANLRIRTLKEDFGNTFEFKQETHGDIPITGVTEYEAPKTSRYKSSLSGVA